MSTAITVQSLHYYPVKSCRGLDLQSARITATGFRHDRRWMVVDSKGRFLTQRRFPRMALVECDVSAQEVLLRAPGMSSLQVAESTTALQTVRVWGFDGRAGDCGDVASRWFSEYLDYPCRLVVANEAWQRPVDADYDAFNTPVLFADGFPFLLISQASLDGLNERLAEPVEMARFRPNIVVNGCLAHAEDDWRKIRLGELIMHIIKPCSRCTIPQVDPATGERGTEPTATLNSYRQWVDGAVYFGQNLIHESRSGVLQVGDTVEILE